MVREHHFSPTELGDFFYDGIDYQGIEWYYEDILEVVKEMKKNNKKK